jgi:hypothetical protein
MYGVFQILKPNAFMNQLEMFKFACPWKGILWNPNSQVDILLRWLTDSLQFLVLTCIRITSLPFMDCINSFYMKNRVWFKKNTKTLQSFDSPCNMSEYNSFLQSHLMYLFTTASLFFFPCIDVLVDVLKTECNCGLWWAHVAMSPWTWKATAVFENTWFLVFKNLKFFMFFI